MVLKLSPYKCVDEETPYATCKCMCGEMVRKEYRDRCEKQCMNYAIACDNQRECIVTRTRRWINNKKVTVTFKIPVGLLNRIDKYADSKFYTRTYVIVKALERFLERREVLRTKRLRIYE